MKKLHPFGLFCALVLMAIAIPAQASLRDSVFVENVPGRLVDLSIQDQWGRPYSIIRNRGKHYLVGQRDRPYVITLTNRSPNRLLAVVSVDGVNVITGDTASFDQAGYILPPYGQTKIEGWRKSMKGVAAFEFSPQAMSYASRTGRPDNVGVIGVAVFEEARRHPRVFIPPAPPPAARSQSSDAMGAASPRAAAESSESLGTGHGEALASQARLGHFDRSNRYPSQVSRLEYDSQANLVRRGLWPTIREADPFPGFVPDPY